MPISLPGLPAPQNFVLLQISRYAEVFDSLVTPLSQISHCACTELIHPCIQQRQLLVPKVAKSNAKFPTLLSLMNVL